MSAKYDDATNGQRPAASGRRVCIWNAPGVTQITAWWPVT